MSENLGHYAVAQCERQCLDVEGLIENQFCTVELAEQSRATHARDGYERERTARWWQLVVGR